MWPKVLAQLFELLPHIGRLIPMADRFFAAKTASEKANEAALAAMAEGVRGDLGQVTKAHAGLYRQLQDQSAQIDRVSGDVKEAAATLGQQGSRIKSIEAQIGVIGIWIKAGVSLLVVMGAIIIWLLVRAH